MNLSVVIYSIMLWTWTTEAHLLVKRAIDCPQITDFSGRVKYRRKGQRAIFRCPKSFTRFGQRAANCLPDGTWDTDSPLCVKDGCIPLDASKVYNLDMDVKKGVIRFTCLEDYVLVGDSLIYCDGQTWSAPLPRCAPPHELTECDFEVDTCGWTQEDADEVDWIRNSGITPTGDTGPKHDHTYMTERTGHYMYFETSTPTESGNTAALKSPSYPEHLSPICFDFWYHMEGPEVVGHVGDLDVYVIDESEFIDDEGVKAMFTQTGNQGSEWQRGEIKIEQQDESFQIVFVATKRISYISDIAIDDVRLYNCTDNSTIGVTPTKPSSTSSTTTTMSVTTAVQTSPKDDSTVPDKAVTSAGETTEQPTTVVASHAPTKYVPSTSAPSTHAPTTSFPSTPAPSTEAPSTSTKSPSTTTVKLTTTTTQSPTTTSTVRPTTEASTTRPQPTTVVTTQSTRPTTVPPTTTVSTTSTPSPTTSTPLPTTGSPVQTSTAAKTSTTVAPTTRQSTTPAPSPSTTRSTTTLAASATTSTPSSTTTSRATPTGKTSTTSSPKVLTTTSKLTQTPTPKATKRSNSLTTKTPTVGNTTKDNTVSVVDQRSKHPEDDTLKPLMIGLGVGIVAGLIIIGVISYVCVRRRKFYTSRYEDELKPITNAASVHSLNEDHFYKDEEYESES